MFLREVASSQSRKAEKAEEEVVRLEGLLEARQLEWEGRQVEEEGQGEDREERVSSAPPPGPLQPLAQQLDSSLTRARSLQQEVGGVTVIIWNTDFLLLD